MNGGGAAVLEDERNVGFVDEKPAVRPPGDGLAANLQYCREEAFEDAPDAGASTDRRTVVERQHALFGKLRRNLFGIQGT